MDPNGSDIASRSIGSKRRHSAIEILARHYAWKADYCTAKAGVKGTGYILAIKLTKDPMKVQIAGMARTRHRSPRAYAEESVALVRLQKQKQSF